MKPSLAWKIKRLLTGKKNLLDYLPMKLNSEEGSIAYCLGVNKEGVHCPRALSCKRYTSEKIKDQEYLNFHENYDIVNCEVFTDVNFEPPLDK